MAETKRLPTIRHQARQQLPVVGHKQISLFGHFQFHRSWTRLWVLSPSVRSRRVQGMFSLRMVWFSGKTRAHHLTSTQSLLFHTKGTKHQCRKIPRMSRSLEKRTHEYVSILFSLLQQQRCHRVSTSFEKKTKGFFSETTEWPFWMMRFPCLVWRWTCCTNSKIRTVFWSSSIRLTLIYTHS